MDLIKTDKKPLSIFLIIVFIFSAGSYFLAFSGEDNLTGGLLLLQFSPAFSAILTKLIFQRNLKGLGWGWGKPRYQLFSLILPFFICLVGFALIWLLGFGGFYNEPFILEVQKGISETFGLNISSPYITMLIIIFVNGTIGLFVGFGAIGEEIGWRGFMVKELMKHFDFTTTTLISGIIWGVFHFPLLILVVAPDLGVSIWPILIFSLLSSIGLSCILAWLRLKSGSLWTAVIFHAALNIHLQGFFQNMTNQTSRITNYISGEQGLMMALITVFTAFLFWRKRDQLKE